jgi:hypothetical protein
MLASLVQGVPVNLVSDETNGKRGARTPAARAC